MADVVEEYAEEGEVVENQNEPEVEEFDEPDDDDNEEFGEPQTPPRPKEDPEQVRLAKALGWKEPTEWKGDTTNYMTAEKYLGIHSKRLEQLPEIQTRAERAEQELQRLRREVMERFQEQDTQSLAKLKAERDKAFDIGDKRQYDAINQQIEQRLSRPQEPIDEQRVQQEHVQQVAADPVFQEFASQNPWFESGMRGDPEAAPRFEYANFVAQQEYQRLGVQNPLELPDALRRQVFNQVAAKVNQFFPNQRNKTLNYQSPNDARSSATPRKKGPSFDALPSEAKQAFSTWVRRKVYSDTPEDRLAYAREFARDNS
jgi:hypothetical protein